MTSDSHDSRIFFVHIDFHISKALRNDLLNQKLLVETSRRVSVNCHIGGQEGQMAASCESTLYLSYACPCALHCMQAKCLCHSESRDVNSVLKTCTCSLAASISVQIAEMGGNPTLRFCST